MFDVEALREELKKYNQEHLLQFWDQLNEAEKKALYHDVKSLNLKEITEIFAESVSSSNGHGILKEEDMEPLSGDVHESILSGSEEKLKSYREEGKFLFK